MRKIVMLVFGSLVALSLAGCGPTPTASTSGGDTKTENTAKKEAPKTLDLKIGESADYDGLKVTVTEAGKGPKDWGGKKSYSFHVKYVNNTEDSASYDPYEWQYEDGNGARHSDIAIIDGKDGLDSGELAPGGKIEGDIYLENKSEMKKVIYSPMFAGEEQKATWQVPSSK